MKRSASYRIIRIVWMAVTFFIQVLLFQKRHRGNFTPTVTEKWNTLVTNQAKVYKKTALELGGLLVKLGQFLSTRADIMPASFIEELEGLTDQVTPVPSEMALQLLDDEWGKPHSEYLRDITSKPVASASIGEVYKAVLHNGAEVAIKIQRPNIERILRADFKAVRIVIWLAKKWSSLSKQIDLNVLYREMTDVIGAELNFLEEMRNGRGFAERFPNMTGVKFPVYYDEYTTRKVLVMEWIEGSKITDLAFLEQHHIDRKDLSTRLFRLFLEQVLEGGQFHADPHGGNILIRPDGTLVLIDFGMVVHITKEDADAMFIVTEGIILKQYDRVIDGLETMNFLLPNADRKVLADAIEKVVKAYESNDLYDMNSMVVENLLQDLQVIVRTQPVQMPAEFAFLGRAVSVFVGVLYILDPEIDLLAITRPRLVEWAKKKSKDKNPFTNRKEFQRTVLNGVGQVRSFAPKISSYLEQPALIHTYLKQRDIDHRKFQVKMQNRLFAGFIAVGSFATFTYSLIDLNVELLIGSSVILLISFWKYHRLGK
ncbi:ABC transporter [Sporosarcina sp. P21c]|uniref:ABC1 kinase family protein n=1 Tax=unclassified Sporosarcina TaxID=2647733 RepID=UPI000C16C136|nr:MULTISPECIES: AarF/UbiB family protein [unclassified Sporosarcina]PIC67388.1 ABC transporter [Sporosarcina sp. P16a]PIC89644.1 ABC transporter [Sporosarcina sp. P21c]PIC92839.1 ABC transporter [Sporosarcina sp. P25]